MRLPAASRLALAVLVLFAGAAHAAEPHYYANDDSPPSYAGDPANLPVGPGVDPQSAIAWARGMPAVRWALDLCRSRGYLRHEDLDQAAAGWNAPSTVVVLALEKPALVVPAGLVGAPIVQVATTLDDGGQPHTQVSGGLVFFDEATAAMRAADDVPGFAGDATFDVQPAAGGGDPVFHTERILHCLRDYAICAGVGNTACVATAMFPPAGWWSVARASLCVAANTSLCLHGFADCWGEAP